MRAEKSHVLKQNRKFLLQNCSQIFDNIKHFKDTSELNIVVMPAAAKKVCCKTSHTYEIRRMQGGGDEIRT